MNLIELIFENWYFVLVAFFVISSFITKAKNTAGNDNQQGPQSVPKQRPGTPAKPRPTMPPFGGEGGWQGVPDLTGRKSSPSAKQAVEQRKAEPRGTQPPKEGRIAASSNTASRFEPSLPSAASTPPNAASRSTSLAAKRIAREALSKHTSSASNVVRTPFTGDVSDNAAQGMMWAEVFGPPRAKKPFRK